MTARQAAADILHRSVSRDGFVADLIDDQLARAPLSPQDRRFVTQLVFGVVRRRATLDALVRPFVNRAPSTVDDRLWDVLHLGAFQLAFLTHVPKHAAVNETVSLAAHVGLPQATGFVNGVLRRVADLITDAFTETPGPAALPFDAGAEPRFRVLAVPMLPDPVADPVGYLAAGFSWPKWLATRWHARYGDWEAARLGFWFNAAPPLWVRTNKLRTDRESYRLQLAAAMIDAEPGSHPQSLRFAEHHPVRDLPGYAAGDFAVQDHSSMLVASALNPQPGNRILDLCAAPGGKTTHLAELADNRAKIVACDPDARRLETVTALCQRLGIKGVETVQLKEGGDPPAGPFDAALVDVPCSNTGVLGRRPEVRWRLKPTEFEHLIRLQTKLLIQAVERVKPGGVVVYSTCSIEPDENEGVVAVVVRALRGLTLEAEHHSVPGRPSDGGYWARLRVPRVAPHPRS
ncbi:16S rRNA (cytosine(967)-C(5))-methyltransferase RsmB [Urbifossiella limnaea]|uniref:Ribosomal RNA small subunit methyltransferase B n=1 Tax=Urbifossiella limnaea TaxID=2528023 RepID=A0A517XYE6_9BACT|nr:16S rRNA (cytosine(967)-C(5))-methyltransferase RsmB [Urbifossiella limnaea]QDU22529.1 Ribosomal RNA small subunit methyltransferase B [Urbifossiella limnaea]